MLGENFRITILANDEAFALLKEAYKRRGIWRENTEEKPVPVAGLQEEVWGREKPAESWRRSVAVNCIFVEHWYNFFFLKEILFGRIHQQTPWGLKFNFFTSNSDGV